MFSWSTLKKNTYFFYHIKNKLFIHILLYVMLFKLTFWIFLKAHGRAASLNKNIQNIFFLSMKKKKKKNVHKESWEKKVAVCPWVKIAELFTFLNLTWWTIWNLYFWLINKGKILTGVHTHFLTSLPTPKLLTKKRFSCLTVAD